MNKRIPPSLNWLIDKRARISGEIEKTKKSLKILRQLTKELKEVEANLSALDKAFELHEIQIDISLITPIKTKYSRLKIPHGEINKAVLTCLKLNSDSSSVPKNVIVDFLINQYYNSDQECIPYSEIGQSVSQALNRLYAKGLIQRLHDPNLNFEGHWKLKK